ncbi:hypothetical protein JOD24_000469 [Kroppenstedtia sanguinis]|uniref:LapA family protein n=1 Tax=Kroppenstedtia sanguinis TaxID=1380684 RepID=A0ABW4CAP5_9BACL
MSEWEPQWVVTLFFALGILFSVSGALWIEKRVEKIRSRRRRNGNGKNFSPGKREKSSPSRGGRENWTPEQDHF